MLKTIRISNFKSISNKTVSFENFNVLVGANAAGKSNFVDTLRFIHDILIDGLRSAVGRRFGWENVLTREKDRSEKITAKIFYDLKGTEHDFKFGKKVYKPLDLKYKLEAGYTRKKVYLNLESFEARFKHNDTETKEEFERSRGKVQIHNPIIFEEQLKSINIPKQLRDRLFLQGFFGMGSSLLSDFIRSWRFYDLDVNAARNPCIDDSQNILLDNGNNLASILDRLKASSSRSVHERILKIMSILVPGFDTWKIERQFDGSLGLKIREKGMTKALLPKMVSDGTIRLLSILVALLYQPSRAGLICIDEPERYLHPQVLKPLIEIMRDVSKKTQIIVTTHSAEVVKWLKPNELLMVDKINTVTHIIRAQNVSMVNKFFEEFSLDELWLGGYLKGGKIL